ncbi:hypothetical protein [Pleionea sediminis]|uniref:hypothetical protein n=1 Tax=Pleionea sediminis TaxID=2569479 RepID=UPI0011858799|nr:hypothetical protein [Pleionea sediminis]
MKYLNSAIASDGGTTWLALKNGEDELFELRLDKKIGSSTSNRLFVNEVMIEVSEEEKWVEILRKTISESAFEYEGEKEMIEHVISSLVSRK